MMLMVVGGKCTRIEKVEKFWRYLSQRLWLAIKILRKGGGGETIILIAITVRILNNDDRWILGSGRRHTAAPKGLVEMSVSTQRACSVHAVG